MEIKETRETRETREAKETKEILNDVLSGKTLEISLYGGKGFVKLDDCMPRLVPNSTADFAIPEMARISYKRMSEVKGGSPEKSEKGDIEDKSREIPKKSHSDDIRLINHLLRHYHTSPFEGVSFKFVMRIPIFVARQLMRHRMAKVNEYSLRYSPAIDAFYFPELRIQDTKNKQGSKPGEVDVKLQEIWTESQGLIEKLYQNYKHLINSGVAKEVARTILPVGEMTELFFEMDLHNLLKMLKLRMASDAQPEIQELARGMYSLIKPIVPITAAAFEKHWLNSESLSIDDQSVVVTFLDENYPIETGYNGGRHSFKSEAQEFMDKIKRMKERRL